MTTRCPLPSEMMSPPSWMWKPCSEKGAPTFFRSTLKCGLPPAADYGQFRSISERRLIFGPSLGMFAPEKAWELERVLLRVLCGLRHYNTFIMFV